MIPPADPIDRAEVLLLAKIAQYHQRDSAGQLLHRHAEALALVDVLIESGTNLLPPNITEELLDAHGLLPLDDRHVVQLEEFDDKFDPLEIGRFDFYML